MDRDYKVAVVTGASSGIGRAIAEKFLGSGYRLVVMARSEQGLLEIKRQSPDRVLVVPGDVTNAADLDRLVDVRWPGSRDPIRPFRQAVP